MHPSTDNSYYSSLANQYLEVGMKFIPRYQELVELGVSLATTNAPQSILDIGSGIGNITVMLLQQSSSVHITAIEPDPAMYDICKEAVAPYLGRTTLVESNIQSAAIKGSFDTIYSNLALHNVSYEEKPTVLKTIYDRLSNDGLFVWGDLIKYTDPAIQDFWIHYRKRYGLEHGGDKAKEFIQANFKKESELDSPYTISDTTANLVAAGFLEQDISEVWQHDTCALFIARKTTRI
jgi:cyclopropane fatty-acyl-phospholipid synthase-like methyltransferase